MPSNFRNLIAWQKSVDLAVEIYRVTGRFPNSEQFALTQQMKRAAISVSSNIAEGRGRSTARDYRNFLFNARGSAYELESQIEVARKLGYFNDVTADNLIALITRVEQLINGLVRSMNRKI